MRRTKRNLRLPSLVAFLAFSKAKLLAAKKFQIKQEYAVHIEVLKRIAKIDKKQALKLTIAAKGQSGRQAEKWMKKFGNQMQGMFGPEDKNKKGKEEQEIEIKDADEIDEQSLQFLAKRIRIALRGSQRSYQAARMDQNAEPGSYQRTINSV